MVRAAARAGPLTSGGIGSTFAAAADGWWLGIAGAAAGAAGIDSGWPSRPTCDTK